MEPEVAVKHQIQGNSASQQVLDYQGKCSVINRDHFMERVSVWFYAQVVMYHKKEKACEQVGFMMRTTSGQKL